MKTLWLAAILPCLSNWLVTDALSPIQPQGSAANPLDKQSVVVIGAGGYLGSTVFGFLQRASSLYGTGLGRVRAVGATADTAARLNRVLSKHFCLAFADESHIKLTNLSNIDMIVSRLDGWQALILGNDLSLQQRPVTAGTYETTPNDKTWEVFWAAPRGYEADRSSAKERATLVTNIVQAAKQAKVGHVVVVEDPTWPSLRPELEAARLQYTCLIPTGPLVDTQDYTYRKGVQGSLNVTPLGDDETVSITGQPIAKEDIAALCVECLQTLDWSQSRCLQVSCVGPAEPQPMSKRPDQEWCVQSQLLREALAGLTQPAMR